MEKLTLNPSQTSLVLANRIYRDFDSPPLSPGAMVIFNGKIREILEISPEDALTRYPSANLLDYRSLTLLPPLVDCHAHLAFDGEDFKASVAQWDEPTALYSRLSRDKNAYLQNGVLLVRDGGDRGYIGWKASRTIPGGPQIITPGKALYKAGMYGSFLGEGIKDINQGLKLIEDLHAEGADFIKVIVSGIVSFSDFGKVGPLQFSREELTCLVDKAHTLKLKVMAHASSDQAVRTAVEAGVDSVEHGYFVDPATLEYMKANGTAWIPTVIPVASQLTHKGPKVYFPVEIEVITRTVRDQLQKIKFAWETGVLLGVGTDAGAYGVPHGKSYVEELLLYQEAGLTPAAVLKTATLNGAAILGKDKHCHLTPGSYPSFIGVEGDPLRNLSTLKQVILICT